MQSRNPKKPSTIPIMSLMMHMIILILMMMIGWVRDDYMENDNATDDDV